jgi:transposase
MDMPAKKPDVTPTEVLPKARRRSFTNAFKRKLLGEADACTAPGQLAALLRRHGLYSSHLTAWRRALDAGELGGILACRRGPALSHDPRAAQVQDLELRLAQMTLRAERAETVVELQKKVAAMLSEVSMTRADAR